MPSPDAQIRADCTRGPCTLSRAEPEREDAGTTRTEYLCLICAGRWTATTTPNGMQRLEKGAQT